MRHRQHVQMLKLYSIIEFWFSCGDTFLIIKLVSQYIIYVLDVNLFCRIDKQSKGITLYIYIHLHILILF